MTTLENISADRAYINMCTNEAAITLRNPQLWILLFATLYAKRLNLSHRLEQTRDFAADHTVNHKSIRDMLA